jgi:hypothetical protein
MKKIFWLFCLPLFFAACKKKEQLIESIKPIAQIVGVDTNYISDHRYNLNVVYFVPTNNPAKVDYERRLSEILLKAAKFYGDQMQINGYGYKTFGLLTNQSKTRIKIVTIPAKLTADKYTNANLTSIITEVEAYFTANPGKKSGEHTLIISPDNQIDNPYVGYGKYCFWPDKGEDATILGGQGGLMHELGHGLNLPHNKERESRVNDPNYGTALMGSGNGTYGKSPTFLTEADCAILNTNQIFQTSTLINYYGPVTAGIRTLYARYVADKDAIIVSGKFSSNIPVTNITYYLDPNYNNEGKGVNKDYNAITWRSNVIGLDSFYMELPMTEMNKKYKGNNPAELKLNLIHENGRITTVINDFNFMNDLPVIDIKPLTFDKTDWKVIAQSSEESEEQGATKITDNNLSTYWFARWSTNAAPLPHYLTIDMGKSLTADGFAIGQRQDLWRTVKDVELLVSVDLNTWISTGNYVVPNVKTLSKLAFSVPKTFRYFKIIIKSNYDTAEPNKSCIAEIGMYKD